MLPVVYLSVNQLKEMMTYFPAFGYLRVQLLQSVFAHLVDLENLWPIIDVFMTEDERAEVIFFQFISIQYCLYFSKNVFSPTISFVYVHLCFYMCAGIVSNGSP